MSDKDYLQFLNSQKKPASNIDELILKNAKADLVKDQIFAVLNVVGIHAIAGTATLAICPQFGWNPLGGNPHLPHILMTYGMWACGMFCGALFMGIGAFLKLFLLRKRTLALFQKRELTNSLIVSSLFLIILMTAGTLAASEAMYFTLIFAGFWFLGSLLVEALSFAASRAFSLTSK